MVFRRHAAIGAQFAFFRYFDFRIGALVYHVEITYSHGMAAHTLEPAYSIINAFATGGESGVTVIARLVGRHPSSVLRWTYPKSLGGTGGGVPRRHYPALKRAAKRNGVPLPLELLTQRGKGEHD